jgi:hypothetical protein
MVVGLRGSLYLCMCSSGSCDRRCGRGRDRNRESPTRSCSGKETAMAALRHLAGGAALCCT